MSSRSRFQQGWNSMLGSLDSVSFLAEAGIPAQHALFREITSRFFQRWLPAPREEDDTARLFAAVFCSSRAVQRFLDMDAALFARLVANLWSAEGLAAYPHVHQDLHEALRLLAARVSARGTSRAVRQRSADQTVEQSPSYALVFATEKFIECEHSASPGDCPDECQGALAQCRLRLQGRARDCPHQYGRRGREFSVGLRSGRHGRGAGPHGNARRHAGGAHQQAFCRRAPVAEYVSARPA